MSWTNSDRFTHSIRLIDTGEMLGILKPGDALTHVFDRPGVNKYDRSFHPRTCPGRLP